MIVSITLVAALATSSADPLAPMDFLVDRCFTATLPDGKTTDTHCFLRLYAPHFLRDEHVVCADGKAVYSGETTYGVEPGSGKLRWRYLSVLGLSIDGYVTQGGDALHFTGNYLANGVAHESRATWTREGEGYRAITDDRERSGEWHTQSDVRFTPDTRTAPACE